MKALIIVDVQNDFCPGGALPVENGNEVVSVINQIQDQFDLVVATQDWHPADHKSFASQHGKAVGEQIELNGMEQVLWPDHCVQGSVGAEFVASLHQEKIGNVFQKGTDVEIDSYSGFFDNGHLKATGLDQYLKDRGVDEVYVTGLATDYCVKFTALDAVKCGFKTFVVSDACRGVDLSAGDVEKAIQEMKNQGVTVLQSNSL